MSRSTLYLLLLVPVLLTGCRDLSRTAKTNPCAHDSCNVQVPSCFGEKCKSPEQPSCPEDQTWVPEKAKCELLVKQR